MLPDPITALHNQIRELASLLGYEPEQLTQDLQERYDAVYTQNEKFLDFEEQIKVLC